MEESLLQLRKDADECLAAMEEKLLQLRKEVQDRMDTRMGDAKRSGICGRRITRCKITLVQVHAAPSARRWTRVAMHKIGLLQAKRCLKFSLATSSTSSAFSTSLQS